MIGKDPQFCSNLYCRDMFDAPWTKAQDRVLLIYTGDKQIRNWFTVDIANQAVSLIDALVGCTSVSRQRHPAGISYYPTAFLLMPYNSCQNRNSDIFVRANPDAGHYQIEEYIDPGAQFGHTGQVTCMMGRRSRANTDNGTRQVCSTQDTSRLNSCCTLLLGEGCQTALISDIIASTCMREDAAQVGAPLV